MKRCLFFVLLPVLTVISMAAAQTAATNAPGSSAATAAASADSSKAAPPAAASSPAATPSGTAPKVAGAVGNAAAALAQPDTAKTKSPPPGKAAPAVTKPDSAKGIPNPVRSQAITPPALAAPAPADTAQAQLPPLPPMRNVITTEKPVSDVPDGVIIRKKAEAPAQAAPQSPAQDGTAPAQAGAVAAPSAITPAIPSTTGPPVKSDSTATAVLPPQKKEQQPAPGQTAKPRTSDTFREEQTLFNSPTGNLRTMKVIIDDQYNLVGMVYGEELGFVRILTADNNGNFKETWKSPPLNSPVRGVFVDNLDVSGEAEIVAYTAEGNIFIFGYDSHEQKYKTADGLYQSISCMLVANVDDDPQKELLFINKAGKMIQFDPVTKFEEWTSTELYAATDMVLGNVDNDSDIELILNTGEVMNLRFKSVEWKMEGNLVRPNSRLYLMDVDSDGILELIISYDQSFVRIIDVDQRREKW